MANFSNNDVYLKTTGPITSNNPVAGVGYATGAGTKVTQAAVTLSGVSVVDTVGTLNCTAPTNNLAVGMVVTIGGSAGSATATGLATGTYYIIATNGSTSFQLSSTSATGSPITTTAGTVGSFTFTIGSGAGATDNVYINSLTGKITTVSLTTAAGAETAFTVYNTSVAAADVPNVVIRSYAGAGTPIVSVTTVAAGSFGVTVTNLHASTALNAALVLNFAVTKGVDA